MSDKKIKAHFVPSTHWDREWYLHFQGFRYLLVKLMDEVLDTLDSDAAFKVFQTDGQSSLVEDYLEIRPERAADVRRLAAENRLRIGPWYTLPDEFIVGGETMVRNLELGLRIAADFGHASRVGFVCDLFGHVSQLPQILRGFGIDNAFVFRGLNEDTHKSVFRWRSPDGSEVVTYQFGPREGYFDYGSQVRKAFDVKAEYVLEEAAQRLADYIDIQHRRSELDTILLFDGGDHMPIDPFTTKLLALARDKRPDVEISHTGLSEFAAALAAAGERIPRVFTGELRDPGWRFDDGTFVIPGVLSSRVRLKQANRHCETQLCLWAEPLRHLAGRLAGLEYPHSYLERSWRYVLLNHAHDSICGCSPDQIHKDMEYRFDQSRLINDELIEDASRTIATRVDLPDLTDEDFALVLFNPSQAAIDGPIDVELWFDEKTDKLYGEFFNFESKVGFRLYDADGEELSYDYLEHWPRRRRFYRTPRKIPMGQECIVVKAAVHAKIPAMGYTTITCKPEKRATRHPQGGIVQNDRTLENEHLRVRVLDNGALELHDKRSGQTYNRVLVFEERADIGDGWYHGVAVNDRIYSSTAAAADVAIVADGTRKGVLRVTNRMVVPECFEFDTKMRRSERTAALLIESDLTLKAGADYLEVTTRIDNQVRDHRVRVLFESGAKTDTYVADSAFDVVEREIALPAGNHTFKELAVETRPQASWAAVHDQQRGLAVVAPGLCESGVRDTPERTLALTLLRGFRRTIFTDGEEGGQSLGRHEFRYRIVPLVGAAPATRLATHAQQLAAGLRSFQVLPRNQAPAGERTLPRTLGQLRMEPGAAILTSMRRRHASETLELRLSNVTDKSITESLELHGEVRSATLTTLDGQPTDAVKVAGGQIKVEIPPRTIATVAVELGG